MTGQGFISAPLFHEKLPLEQYKIHTVDDSIPGKIRRRRVGQTACPDQEFLQHHCIRSSALSVSVYISGTPLLHCKHRILHTTLHLTV